MGVHGGLRVQLGQFAKQVRHEPFQWGRILAAALPGLIQSLPVNHADDHELVVGCPNWPLEHCESDPTLPVQDHGPNPVIARPSIFRLDNHFTRFFTLSDLH